VIAVTGTDAYVRVRRLSATEFVRLPLQGGEGERLAIEGGIQQGVLANGVFYWTAASTEAPPDTSIQSVKRGAPAEGGQLVTDWIPGDARLFTHGARVYSAGLYLYRIPEQPGPPELVRKLNTAPKGTDGPVVLDFYGAKPQVLERLP
jgi:hypothetical protein